MAIYTSITDLIGGTPLLELKNYEAENKLEAKIPGTGENLASEAKKKTLKTQCTAHGIDLDAWVCGNGKTVDTLTETECAKMLNAIKKKYGDD